MYCKYCGADIPDDSGFCEKCGKKVIKKISPEEKSPKKATSAKAAQKPPKRNKKLIITLSIVLPLVFIGIIIGIIIGSVRSCSNYYGPSTTTYVEEEAVEEEADEVAYEEDTGDDYSYYEECDVTFDEQNLFEIGQEGLDLGYPSFTYIYPDGWEAMEFPDYLMGYLTVYQSPTTVYAGDLESGDPIYPSTVGETLIILSEEEASREPDDVVGYWTSRYYEQPCFEVLEFEPTGDDLFIMHYRDSQGNEWYTRYQFIKIGDNVVLYIFYAIDYCYERMGSYFDEYVAYEHLYVGGDTKVVEKEETKAQTQATKPTISLSIIEGPTKSGNMCYYRIKATVTGSPTPSISFNKDDSNGNLGSNVAQINIYSEDESYTLSATTSNSAGSATDSITVKGCAGMIAPEEPKPPDDEDEEQQVDYGPPIIVSGGGDIEVFICYGEQKNIQWSFTYYEDSKPGRPLLEYLVIIPITDQDAPVYTYGVSLSNDNGYTVYVEFNINIHTMFCDP